MKRETDYKSMYQEMVYGAEEAIAALSNSLEIGMREAIVQSLRSLIRAERTSEEIYIETSGDNLIVLHPENRSHCSAENQ